MTKKKLMTRRELMTMLTVAGAGSLVLDSPQLCGLTGNGEWVKYAGGPVLGGEYGTCFDICV